MKTLESNKIILSMLWILSDLTCNDPEAEKSSTRNAQLNSLVSRQAHLASSLNVLTH